MKTKEIAEAMYELAIIGVVPGKESLMIGICAEFDQMCKGKNSQLMAAMAQSNIGALIRRMEYLQRNPALKRLVGGHGEEKDFLEKVSGRSTFPPRTISEAGQECP